MCGRYTVTPTLSQLLAGLDLDTLEVPESSEPVVERFNVAPTQPVLAVTRGRDGDGPRAKILRWGLIPYWSKDPRREPLRINARVETLTERPAFRTLVEDHRSRCLLLADGYYEWLKAEDLKQPRRPMHFTLPDREPFAFAGLWNTWKSPDGERIGSCTIITGPPNRVAASVHDRMPVILPGAEERAAWLDPALDASGVAPLLHPLRDELLQVHRASTRVNAATYDAPDCLDEDDDEPEESQLTLAI
jgi:putative SOS response-associated peptidase YedK